MKISFDFDGTLERDSIMELARMFINRGDEVWCVTSRNDVPAWNRDLYSVCSEVGIKRENICFTYGNYKWGFLNRNKFDFHFDDDYMEIKEALKNGCSTLMIPILNLDMAF